MASYLQIENISKSYGPKVLFENISFNVNEGDKIALIAPNGTGKTSLMRILAGKDKSDSGGKIMFLKDIRIAFLEQEYDFDPKREIFTQIMESSRDFTSGLDQEHLWEYERRVKRILTEFRLGDGSRTMEELSGGEVKRVALTQMLASEAEFLIMDEPTNHLDIDAIEYLENYLKRSRCTLLMVTHDRYFLDSVCNIVMEMERGAVYTYRGDYENYLEKRDERISNWNANTDKVRNILRRELEWIRSTPCARSGKAKYRIDAFYKLKDRSEEVIRQKSVDMSGVSEGMSGSGFSSGAKLANRLGSKIIDCKDVSFHYGDECYLDHFSYNFSRGEKVGIVGRNGVGKSTFIDLLTGNLGGYTGTIERGESVKVGYYRQSGMSFDEDQTVLETVNDTSLLNRFLFPHDMLNNKVSKLSGGERRRLYLLTILMRQPNLLILDEPTNDLDIVTLNVLEEYLKDYQGSLVIVSHDRHFLDRLVDHLLIFTGNGKVKDFIGGYSEYREYIKTLEAAEKSQARAAEAASKPVQKQEKVTKKKLSWKEQKELEALEAELDKLGAEKKSLEELLSNPGSDMEQTLKASERIGGLLTEIDEKELRLLELYEKQS
ncbi:MAG: ABC-F family ATP-binding cassette domain-containing protein [Candidatus Cryptobacteroides sp.]|nr:ABC-F family ATP-binding cassette domain-containing protein [Candidatus Cryptobacteroides sp.]